MGFVTGLLVSSIITLIICIVGFIGNILCFAVLLHKDTKRTSYKYLLLALSLSDIFLLGYSVLTTLQNLEILSTENEDFETIVFFWDWICTSGTKYFTVAISLERFFVVAFPFKAHCVITPWRSKLFALSILGFVLLLSCFSYIYVNYIDPSSFDVYAAVVLHFTPFIIVLIFNVLIFLALRRHKRMRAATLSSASAIADSKEDSATPMLFAVVVVFGVCYSFEFIRRVMNFAWPEYMNQYDYYDYPINHLADIFYALNSSVNFFIYFLFGSSFRATFRKVFEDLCCCGAPFCCHCPAFLNKRAVEVEVEQQGGMGISGTSSRSSSSSTGSSTSSTTATTV